MKPAVTHRGPAAGVITSEDAEIDYESYESEEDDGARETKDNRGAQGASARIPSSAVLSSLPSAH